jgi:ParB/RepB/Spo0J family partition protein
METKEMSQTEVSVDQIEVGSNFRRSANASKLKELSENIKKVGVLEPVLLRRNGSEKLLLIAGSRRLEASKMAGLAVVPARILEVDEKWALEIQAFENLHREDMSPMDEARAFKTLLDLGSHTPESLAGRVDKSVSYVYRSLRLLDLPESAIKALDEGIITTGHALQILRAPKKNAEDLAKFATTRMEWQKRYPTVDELKQHIAKRIEKDLSSAPFPKSVEYAEAVACTNCPFNTGNQDMLFDGAVKGHCTNPSCFNKKTGHFYRELQAEGKEKFKGLNFIGSTADLGYGTPQIKGAFVVQKVDEKITKAMKEHPDQFGYGILKASRWGGQKPKLVLLCKDAKLAGQKEEPKTQAYKEPTPEEREEMRFIQHHIFSVYWKTVLEEVEVNKDTMMRFFSHLWQSRGNVSELALLLQLAGVKITLEDRLPTQALEKLSTTTLMKVAFLVLHMLTDVDSEELIRKKVDVKKLQKDAATEARKLWASRPKVEEKSTKEMKTTADK